MISFLSVPEQHSEPDGSTHLPPRRTRRRWRQYKSSTPRTKNPRIWVQLGCHKTSREFLRAPRVAMGAVKLQTVTSGRWTVTAEVASSSLVVPAIHSRSGPNSPLRLMSCCGASASRVAKRVSDGNHNASASAWMYLAHLSFELPCWHCFQRADIAFNLTSNLIFGDFQVIARLEIHPERRTIVEVARET